MYDYFLWDHIKEINGCSAEEVEKQHKLNPEDTVYFVTLNGIPDTIMPANCEEEYVTQYIEYLKGLGNIPKTKEQELLELREYYAKTQEVIPQ